MKKTTLLTPKPFSAILLIFIALIAIAPSNAVYFSRVTAKSDFDNIKATAAISLYMPGWIGGYDSTNDWFAVSGVPTAYSNIHYSVTNKADGTVNKYKMQYYVRIVAEDESNDIPIEYNVHEYNNANAAAVYPKDSGGNYGPFALTSGTETTTYFSIMANWNKDDKKYKKKTQKMKVQMCMKRMDNSFKVLSEAPLRMAFTGFVPVGNTPVKAELRIGDNAGNSTTIGEKDLETDATDKLSFTKESIKGWGYAQFSDRNSFTIYIKNNENFWSVGITSIDGEVIVEYDKVYGDGYSLSKGMQLCIIAW